MNRFHGSAVYFIDGLAGADREATEITNEIRLSDSPRPSSASTIPCAAHGASPPPLLSNEPPIWLRIYGTFDGFTI